jgi:hypothetical protein
MKVDKRLTPRSRVELAGDVGAGHVAAFKGPPCLTRWAGIVGHLSLEHGNGKALFNFDYGNVTASGDWKRDPARDWIEMLVPPPDPPSLCFRSLPGPEAGIESYLRVMAGRYMAALECWDRGDYEGGCAALKARGYMTAALGPYTSAVASIARSVAVSLIPGLIAGLDRPGFVCTGPNCDGDIHSLLTVAEIEETLALVYDTSSQIVGDELDADRIRRRESGE